MAETNYFYKSAYNLTPGSTHNFQFRWKYVDGTYSQWSATKSATSPGSTYVSSPTLATGFSTEQASFAVVINWDGTYSSSAFLGFKAINIYASTSDLGSSTTTNLSASIVGSMTVDQVKNKITIGSTLLQNVLSLNNTTVYTTPIYFYYITVNENNEVYKSGGVATYTRINSSGTNPLKANFIDLESGTISIENLVAGNGQFQAWLRAGTAGSARIELSSQTTSFTAGGYSVLPGFTIYNSANTQIFRADLSGNLTLGGTFQQADTGNGYIKLPVNPSDRIEFYNSSFDTPGFIRVAPISSGNSGLFLKPATNAAWTAVQPQVEMYSDSSGGTLAVSSYGLSLNASSSFQMKVGDGGISISGYGGTTPLTSAVMAYSYATDPSIMGFRNIQRVSTAGQPGSGEGRDGEIRVVAP